jgi:ribosomal RNA-processing protein 8
MTLEERLNRRLEGSKFRLLNERLYSRKPLSQKDIEVYHKCYSEQIKKWPVNPLDRIISAIQQRNPGGRIVDLGCGEARISDVFENVDSFDTNPVRKHVKRCDMKKVPLEDDYADIVVCCLSLMMAHIAKVVKEVNRILKMGGVWYIAEVKSRIRSIKRMTDKIEEMGFTAEEVDVDNERFALLVLRKKASTGLKRLPEIKLGPCLYKRR